MNNEPWLVTDSIGQEPNPRETCGNQCLTSWTEIVLYFMVVGSYMRSILLKFLLATKGGRAGPNHCSTEWHKSEELFQSPARAVWVELIVSLCYNS